MILWFFITCVEICMVYFIFFSNVYYNEIELTEFLNKLSFSYYEELSNIINVTNKLEEVISVFVIILLAMYSFKYCIIFCYFHKIGQIFLIIEIFFIFIIWSVSLSININLYKMRENIYLHEIVERPPTLNLILSFSYLVYLIIKLMLIVYNDNKKSYNNKTYKYFIPMLFIFEFFLNIFTLIFIPEINHYRNSYFQNVYSEFCQKYEYCPIKKNNYELENLEALNKTFLSFIIIIFFLTILKFIASVRAYCNDNKYRKSFLIPSFIQTIFIIINFCLITVIASKIYGKGKSNAFNLVTYQLKKKVLITLINAICYIILLVLELILVIKDKEESYSNSNGSRFETYSPINVRVSRFVPAGVIPKEIEEIIKELEEKINDFTKTFNEEEKEVKDKLTKFLEERHSKLDEFIKILEKEKNDTEKNNKKELEKFIKDLNNDEYGYEIDILINEVNKMHFIFKLSEDIIKKCKDLIIQNLKEKMSSLPSIAQSKIESKINEITNFNSTNFLDSPFGKPLKTALEKYAVNSTSAESLKDKLMNERKERRENEKKEFSLEKNTFGDEENIIKVDLYKFITEEFNDGDFKNSLKNEILGQISIISI